MFRTNDARFVFLNMANMISNHEVSDKFGTTYGDNLTHQVQASGTLSVGKQDF